MTDLISPPVFADGAGHAVVTAADTLSMLSGQAERWLSELATVRRSIESLHTDVNTWHLPDGQSQRILPSGTARTLLISLLAEGPRRIEYVLPATVSLLDQQTVHAAADSNPEAEMRELLSRPAQPPAPVPAAAAESERVQVRATTTDLRELAIVDGETAFIPTETSAAIAVVRGGPVIGILTRFFADAWNNAALTPRRRPALKSADCEIKVRIVSMLAEGVKDEAIARRLCMSLRTCRRHVAEILQDLDSSSRFQAGVRAGLLGLVPAPQFADRDR